MIENTPRPDIDAALNKATSCQDIPCVAAIVASSTETIYQGAFGKARDDCDTALGVDAIFRAASMTKAVTSVAAMQLIERGDMQLDDPVENHVPSFSERKVLTGFDEESGRMLLREPKSKVTVRQLMTHTAGFGYEIWNEQLLRAVESGQLANVLEPSAAMLDAPLLFDPGSQWEYGISTDWLGKLVEVISGRSLENYFADEVFEPLGMVDTAFNLPADKYSRLVSVRYRQDDGSMIEAPNDPASKVTFFSGGGGLHTTAPDYIRFLRALLRGGELDGARILSDTSVTLMGHNQIGGMPIAPVLTAMPAISNSVDMFRNSTDRFGLGFMITENAFPGGRSNGSLSWAGLYNGYYWIDPAQDICAVFMSQLLPFFDARIVTRLSEFEAAVYSAQSATTPSQQR